MNVNEGILKMIARDSRTVKKVDEKCDLYHDLGYDSLAFIALLIKIEEAYGVNFCIDEMHECLVVERLLGLVNKKLGVQGAAI